MSIAIVKKEEMAPQYDANGFSRMEMLPGTFPGAHNYKCFLKAGHDVQPEKYADKTAVYCCCFSKRMRNFFRKNEKSVLQFCNKKPKRKGRLQRVEKSL